MKIKELDYKKIAWLCTYVILLIAVLFNLGKIFNVINYIIAILSPIIIGIVIAFILNLLMKKYEKLMYKKEVKAGKTIKGAKRVLSIVLTYLTISLILLLISVLLIPELIESGKVLINNLSFYSEEIKNFSTNLMDKNEVLSGIVKEALSSWVSISESITKWLVSMAPKLINSTVTMFGSVLNFVLGVVFSVYLLYSKERILKNVKKTLYAYFNKSKADKINKVATTTNKTFGNFVGGQLVEAVILGTLCSIGMFLLDMPYAVLIGVVIGTTSIIPIFGAYLGAIPSAFLLLMEDPIMALIFIVFLIILQQFEGNVIYPRVVGKSVGLTGFWILFAVVVGAAIGGIAGVLIAVPLCAVIYSLLKEEVNKKLTKKKIKIDQ